MRHFSYNELSDSPNENLIITKSEEEIRKEFYSYWYGQMCNKFGQEVVDRDYSFEDCLDD